MDIVSCRKFQVQFCSFETYLSEKKETFLVVETTVKTQQQRWGLHFDEDKNTSIREGQEAKLSFNLIKCWIEKLLQNPFFPNVIKSQIVAYTRNSLWKKAMNEYILDFKWSGVGFVREPYKIRWFSFWYIFDCLAILNILCIFSNSSSMLFQPFS